MFQEPCRKRLPCKISCRGPLKARLCLLIQDLTRLSADILDKARNVLLYSSVFLAVHAFDSIFFSARDC